MSCFLHIKVYQSYNRYKEKDRVKNAWKAVEAALGYEEGNKLQQFGSPTLFPGTRSYRTTTIAQMPNFMQRINILKFFILSLLFILL